MYSKIVGRINQLLDQSEEEVILVAIDGPSAGGKSYLSKFLSENFICNVFHMDDFFLTPDLRTPQRFAELGGNVDYDRFAHQVLENIMRKNDFTYDIFDCRTLSLSPSSKIFHKRLNIVEGVYALHPTLADYYDYKIFLNVAPAVQRQRILERSSAFMLERFEQEWIPLENSYFSGLNIKEQCHDIYNTSELF